MRLAILVNDGAGSVDRADRDSQESAIVEAFADAGVDVAPRWISPAHMADEMREIWDGDDRPDAIVVAGGDGTVNAAAGVAMDTDMVLGVLPMGTFDHFAKDLGMGRDLATAASDLAGGELRRVDVGEVNGRVFVNNSALGVYPAMVAVRERLAEKRGWGKVRGVVVASVRVLRAFPVHRLTLEGPDGYDRTRIRTPLVFVGNGRFEGEDGRVGERDAIDDGCLGIYVARVTSRTGLLGSVLRTVLGRRAARSLDHAEVSELTVSSNVKRLRVALDGEVRWLETPLRYRSRPGALRVLAPPVARVDPPTGDPNEVVDPNEVDEVT